MSNLQTFLIGITVSLFAVGVLTIVWVSYECVLDEIVNLYESHLIFKQQMKDLKRKYKEKK